VLGNVCFDHIGHGYFVEDGGEQGNVFDGNLGLGTRPGSGLLLPSDAITGSATGESWPGGCVGRKE
jgi:hypothetical protein